jgi:hypothetical protein
MVTGGCGTSATGSSRSPAATTSLDLSEKRTTAMLPASDAQGVTMEKRTLEQLEAALDAVGEDLSPRVEELAQKSTAGLLTEEERREYSEIVRLNDMLSLLRLQAEEFWTMRAAS